MTHSWKPITLLISILCAVTIPVAADPQTEVSSNALTEARQAVRAFEEPLLDQVLSQKGRANLLGPDEVQDAVRTFFAGLSDSTMKIAATEMLDSRYVYAVEQDMLIELLGPLIRDADPAVRTRAAMAVGYNRCGARYFDEIRAMIENDPPTETLVSAAYAMGRSGHLPFVPHLVKQLGHPEPGVRSTASFELSRLAPTIAFEHNLRLLNDQKASVRKAAIQSLAGTQDLRAIAPIERLLGDEVQSVRERALWSLGHLESYSSADLIADRLTDPHHHVRGRAAEVLGNLQATQHVDAVVALLIDEDVVVRRYATKAMGSIGDQRHIKSLRPLLDDADDQIRKHAEDSIRQLDAIKTDGEQSDDSYFTSCLSASCVSVTSGYLPIAIVNATWSSAANSWASHLPIPPLQMRAPKVSTNLKPCLCRNHQ